MPVQVTPRATITERLKRLRLRIYLERISGIAATNEEAYLEVCRQYEQGEQLKSLFQDACEGDNQGPANNPLDWGKFHDWNKYEPFEQEKTYVRR